MTDEFRSKLRQAQQSAQERRRKSDEDVYQDILHRTYEQLKTHILGRASNSRSNIVSGEYRLRPANACINSNELEHKQSIYHVVCSGECGPEVESAPICKMETRNGFISLSAKVTLTQFGKRLTDDVARLGKKDGISVWFTPLFVSAWGEQPLSKFETFEKITVNTSNARGEVVLHYRITL